MCYVSIFNFCAVAIKRIVNLETVSRDKTDILASRTCLFFHAASSVFPQPLRKAGDIRIYWPWMLNEDLLPHCCALISWRLQSRTLWPFPRAGRTLAPSSCDPPVLFFLAYTISQLTHWKRFFEPHSLNLSPNPDPSCAALCVVPKTMEAQFTSPPIT